MVSCEEVVQIAIVEIGSLRVVSGRSLGMTTVFEKIVAKMFLKTLESDLQPRLRLLEFRKYESNLGKHVGAVDLPVARTISFPLFKLVEPSASREVAEQFAKAGSIMLDGPLSGSPVTVKAGQASIMIGGDEDAFERAKPVLLAIGPKVTRIGGNGLACQMKIAVNLLLMVEVICFGEAVALAEKGGVGREIAVDAILKSVAASPVLGYRGPFIIEGKMPAVPLADVTLQQKDMLLALNLARELGSPAPLAAAANEMMNACRGLGIDANDFVVAHQVYRRLGGQGSGGQS